MLTQHSMLHHLFTIGVNGKMSGGWIHLMPAVQGGLSEQKLRKRVFLAGTVKISELCSCSTIVDLWRWWICSSITLLKQFDILTFLIQWCDSSIIATKDLQQKGVRMIGQWQRKLVGKSMMTLYTSATMNMPLTRFLFQLISTKLETILCYTKSVINMYSGPCDKRPPLLRSQSGLSLGCDLILGCKMY